MSYSQSDYETAIRQTLGDLGWPYEESRIVEDLTNQVVGGNGNRLTFNLSHTNISSSGTMVNINEIGFASTGFTVDQVNGIVIFASGVQPTLSTTYPYPTKFETLYYFQHFQTSDLDEFVNYGLGKFKLGPMTGDNSTQDFANTTSDIFNCILLYAVAQAYYRLSSKYARLTNNSAQGKSSGKSAIAQRYEDLGKEYLDAAEKERLAIYGPRQGRSTAAALQITHNLPRGRFWQAGGHSG